MGRAGQGSMPGSCGIGGARPMIAGEHLYCFLYRATPNQTACVESGCFLKREHSRVTAPFVVR